MRAQILLAATLYATVMSAMVLSLTDNCSLCALSANEIPIASGVTRTVDGCCSGNFEFCGTGEARCRVLATYAIQPAALSAADEEVCQPSTEPGCTCQEGLNAAINISMKLCPSTKQCCSSCRCIGDPHCVSFGNEAASWVVCDVRNAECQLPPPSTLSKTCSQQTYQGAQCLMRPDLTGHTFCQYPLSKPPPTLNMYSRTYVSTTTGLSQVFNITLQLGVFGSIDTITILDGGSTYKFGFSFKNKVLKCIVPSNLNQISSGKISGNGGTLLLDKLDSGVLIELQCIVIKHMWGTRWEVLTLQDDFLSGLTNRAGFCQTGIIPESAGSPETECNMDRTLLTQFNLWGYYCQGPSSSFGSTAAPSMSSNASDVGGVSITLCKQNWCSKPLLSTGTGINWVAANFSSLAACQNFVSVPGDNFLAAVCCVAPGVDWGHPATCSTDEACSNCVNDLKDFPIEMVDILKPAAVHPPASSQAATRAPTSSCDPDSLLTLGLENAASGALLVTGGVKLLFQAEDETSATLIWQATDAEIEAYTSACGCIDFLLNSESITFTSAGNYTIQQCFPENEFVMSQCLAAPTYLLEVDYPTLPTGTDFSIPFGSLVATSSLVCADTTECPPNSLCCIWTYQGLGWSNCLGSLATQYPNCGKSVSCPGCP